MSKISKSNSMKSFTLKNNVHPSKFVESLKAMRKQIDGMIATYKYPESMENSVVEDDVSEEVENYNPWKLEYKACKSTSNPSGPGEILCEQEYNPDSRSPKQDYISFRPEYNSMEAAEDHKENCEPACTSLDEIDKSDNPEDSSQELDQTERVVDRLIDIKRLESLFEVNNNKVKLKVKGPQLIKAMLETYLNSEDCKLYRAAMNLLMAYRFIKMDKSKRKSIKRFFKKRNFEYKFEEYSSKIGLSANQLRNYKNLIGTQRFMSNINVAKRIWNILTRKL